MIILPELGNLREGLPQLGLAVVRATLFLAAMVLIGTRIIPAILKWVAAWNSRELFLITITALGLGIGYGTYLVGLSFAFGAFVAGMVLSEIEQLSDSLRNEHYRALAAMDEEPSEHDDAALLERLRRTRNALEIAWYELPAESPLANHTIGDGAIRRRSGASIVAVVRRGATLTNPGPEMLLRPGDRLAILGTSEQRSAFDQLLHSTIVVPTSLRLPDNSPA